MLVQDGITFFLETNFHEGFLSRPIEAQLIRLIDLQREAEKERIDGCLAKNTCLRENAASNNTTNQGTAGLELTG